MSSSTGVAGAGSSSCFITTSVTASSVEGCIAEIKEAVALGVDIVELRLDFLQGFQPERDLDALMASCPIPYIVTYRPKWEGCVDGGRTEGGGHVHSCWLQFTCFV